MQRLRFNRARNRGLSATLAALTISTSLVAAPAGAASKVTSVPVQVPFSTQHYGTFSSVSCTSPTFCAAGGYFDTGSGQRALVGVFNGTSWSGSEIAQSLSTPGANQVDSVSCYSTVFCVAVGHVGIFNLAFVSVYNGTHWTSSLVNLAFTNLGAATYNSVSCPTATFCVAGGNYFDTGVNQEENFVSVYRSGVWTSSKITASLNDWAFASLDQVTCRSASFCVAVGGYSDASHNSQAFASIYNGSTWTDSELASALNVDGAAEAVTVSCPSTTMCVAGGNYRDSSGVEQAFVSKYSGTAWTDTEVAGSLEVNGAHVNAISCATTTFCVAGGDYGGPGSEAFSFLSVFKGSTWSSVTAAVTGQSTSNSTFSVINSIDCVSTTSCFAGGTFDDSANNIQIFIGTYNGTTWGSTEAAAALNTGGEARMADVSCGAARFCVGAGDYVIKSTGYVQALVVVDNSYSTQAALTITSTRGQHGHWLLLKVAGGSDHGPVTYTVKNGSAHGCALSKKAPFEVTAASRGTCVVTATMAGNSIYAPVTSKPTAVSFS